VGAQNTGRASSEAVSRLPYPLNRLGGAGLNLWSAISGREGTRPEFRVGQVDAELLDEELLELLKGQVGEGLKYFGVGISHMLCGALKLTMDCRHISQIPIRRKYCLLCV
jgi:peroxin-2